MTDARNALIIGATSSLAYALCHRLAKQGWNLQLCGRDESELRALASDLQIRYAVDTECIIADLSSLRFSSQAVLEQVRTTPEAAFIVAGDMGDTEHQEDIRNIAQVTLLNYLVPAQLITLISERMAENGKGDIVVISSVAGDRGRQSNYVYGSAKAALSAFCGGLRHKFSLEEIPVHVMTVKPGFIDTPLTYAMQSPLVLSREKAAKTIISAMENKKATVYVPFFWRYIMLIICNLPECIFKKLKL